MGFFKKKNKPDEHQALLDKLAAMEQELAQMRAMLDAQKADREPPQPLKTAAPVETPAPQPAKQAAPVETSAPQPAKQSAFAATSAPKTEARVPQEAGWFDMIEYPAKLECRGCLELRAPGMGEI